MLALQLRRALATQKRIQRRKEYSVPKQKFPRGAQLQYAAGLKQMQSVVEQATKGVVYPDLNQIPLAPPDYIIKKVGQVRFAVGEHVNINEIENLAAKVGDQLNLFNRGEVGRQLKSVIGIDPIMAEPWIGEHLFTLRRENVNLVKSLFGTELDDLENLLLRANRGGLQVNVIRKQIEDRFGLSRQRAMLIARDQVGKLNGELTQLRQTGLGVEEYIWRCSKDERVRGNPDGRFPRAVPSHWAREGQKFKWSEPPEGGHPGQPVS